MGWFLLVFYLVAAVVLLSKEILFVGDGRRRGLDKEKLYRRFRRRSKGILLVGWLVLIAGFWDGIVVLFQMGGREVLALVGLSLILLIWVLILSARDLQESAFQAVEESSRARKIAIQELEEEMKKVVREEKD